MQDKKLTPKQLVDLAAEGVMNEIIECDNDELEGLLTALKSLRIARKNLVDIGY